jgi:hypothetical protein
MPDGVEDMAFTWSDWTAASNPGASTCPPAAKHQPDERAHTVFDRTLLRAGETVSMKHLLRSETRQGFGAAGGAARRRAGHHPCGQRPAGHAAAGWRKTATGGLSAESELCRCRRPPSWAQYQVALRGAITRRRAAPVLDSGELPGGGVPPARV